MLRFWKKKYPLILCPGNFKEKVPFSAIDAERMFFPTQYGIICLENV